MVPLCLVSIILSQMVSSYYLDSAYYSFLGQTGGRIMSGGGYHSIGLNGSIGVYGHPYIEVRNAPILVYPQYGMSVTFHVPPTCGNDSAETLRRRWLEYRP